MKSDKVDGVTRLDSDDAFGGKLEPVLVPKVPEWQPDRSLITGNPKDRPKDKPLARQQKPIDNNAMVQVTATDK